MTITVSPADIGAAKPGELECPIFRALRSAGLSVSMVGCGLDPRFDTLVANAYLIVGDDALIQSLPGFVAEAIKLFDKTGKMEPMAFDLPDL